MRSSKNTFLFNARVVRKQLNIYKQENVSLKIDKTWGISIK